MRKTTPLTVICTYRVKPGKEATVRKLLAKSWRTLHKHGLVTDERPIRLQGTGRRSRYQPVDQRTIVEIFAWKDQRASSLAHRHPEVLSIWEPLGSCCESMEFPNFTRA